LLNTNPPVVVQLEEMKLMQLLVSLKGTLPADSPALQDDSEELQEAIAGFLRRDGMLPFQKKNGKELSFAIV